MAERSKMAITGVGPRFVVLALLYTAAGIALRLLWPDLFTITVLPRWLLSAVGISLLVVGVPYFVLALRALLRGFPEGKLMTSGVHATCSHPAYGAWVVFNVPGMILLSASWPGLAVILAMYVTLRLLVREEERYLEETFGQEYRDYAARTPAVFPLLWRLLSREPG